MREPLRCGLCVVAGWPFPDGRRERLEARLLLRRGVCLAGRLKLDGGRDRLDARRRRRGERELRDPADLRFGEVAGGGELATMRDGRSGVGEPLPGARGEVRVDERELGAQHVVRRHGRNQVVQCPHDVLIGSPRRALYRGRHRGNLGSSRTSAVSVSARIIRDSLAGLFDRVTDLARSQ